MSDPLHLLPTLTSLLPSTPTLTPLLITHKPFSHPSHLPTTLVHKFLNKLGSFVTVPIHPGGNSNNSRAVSSGTGAATTTVGTKSEKEWKERADAWGIAKIVVEQDKEGFVLGGGWGKVWFTNLLGLITNPPPSLPSTYLPALFALLLTIQTYSPLSPSFQRSVTGPALVKVSIGILKSLERLLSSSSTLDPSVLETGLITLDNLIALNPTPHRPILPTLLPLLQTLLLSPPGGTPFPRHIQKRIPALLARLHTLSGKTSSSGTFKGDLEGMIREGGWCLDALGEDVWVGGIGVGSYSNGGGARAGAGVGSSRAGSGIVASISASQPLNLMDRSSTLPNRQIGGTGAGQSKAGMLVIGDKSARLDQRLNGWARCLDGWVDGVLGMLQFQTARPVALPLGSLISLGMRCLALTPDAQLEDTLDDETRALALVLRTRIWACGMKVLGGVIIAAGDHVLPNVGLILDKSVHLLESLPKTDHSARIALFKFHTLLLSHLQLDPSSASFHARLIKHALASISLLMDTKTPVLNPSSVDKDVNGDSVGKKGKKRARGAADEVVVAGIEGRGGRGLSKAEGVEVLSALGLIKILHHHPTIPPHLLALSIRVHLSASHVLDSKNGPAVSREDPGLALRLTEVVLEVLEDAMMIEGSGIKQGWVGSIARQESFSQSSVLPLILHPSAPPLSRPLPPASSLAFYSVDHEEEEQLRKEIGIRTSEDSDKALLDMQNGTYEDEDEDEIAYRVYKRPASDDRNVKTKTLPESSQTSRSQNTTAASVFGGSAASATSTLDKPTMAVEPTPAMPLSVPSIESAPTGELPVAENPVSSHQPTEVAVKDDAKAATAAMTEPFSSITTNLPARPEAVEVAIVVADAGTNLDDEDDAIPEINLDSDSEDDDEDME